MAIIIEGTECEHSYSKSWQEPRPRKCRKCGELEYIPKRMADQQLFQSSPMAFLNLEPIKSKEESLSVLYGIVRDLHRLKESGDSNNFYRYINSDDFHSIWLYLTECWYGMDTQFGLAKNKLKEEKLNKMGVKPLSPEEVEYGIPDFVLETVNKLITKKFRGSSFTIKAKEIIAEGKKCGHPDAKKDWYEEKWMDIENIYGEMGWDVEYDQPSYGDSDFDSYYKFTPKTKK